ncbi:hypothetical protein [Paenibacillus lautus]|uniref:hypothetical protein n=1 Tax=Paenibacillus lautus TaxID=1401 RepID=UPI001C7DC5A0|nr:hypothetical protein [Paenibacillus lautus]MBX4147411.1 hypothetical protein [Paenibacillus lautus]
MASKRQGIKRYASLLLSLALIFSLSGLAPPGEAEAANSKYKKFFDISKKGAAIPGYSGTKEWIPQGLALVPSKNWIIISHYWGNKDSNQASSISITSSKTNKRIKTLYLYESGSKKHTGHVGGLAVSKKHLWVASGKKVYKIPLSTISSKKDYGNIVMTPYALGHKASYATYSDGILWIGEYMDGEDQGGKQCAPGPKGKLRGYPLTSSDALPPNRKAAYTWSTPDRIQGAVVTKTRVVYSQSCGRNNASKLLIYTRGTKGKAAATPLTMPPMSENIAMRGHDLYVLFESGARKYRNGALPLKHLYIVNARKLKL